ncbi:defensin Ec-AMP-D2-like [Beta vulgaris subsp. vulgaris]|uniref:defensin Ec-AMP-D2-like n=1 Tax=Beta vulgaris subsp. vulgaris TaxID=3555 RepID=UPI002036F167|nr:defensin Ec-AMP-D2-like [Beta vulgaris subsp. vulgaris]
MCNKSITEVGTKVVEARICESPSYRFRGICVSRNNCANVCKTEGFPGGRCRGFRRRCFCYKHCA